MVLGIAVRSDVAYDYVLIPDSMPMMSNVSAPAWNSAEPHNSVFASKSFSWVFSGRGP